MKSVITHQYKKKTYRLIALLIAMLSVSATYAFDLSTYAENSVLSDGKWVKISVPQSGVYKISKSQLAQWGFNDLSKVKIYGYGGNRIPDKLLLDNFIDDLPPTASATVTDGIIFYGVGPETWTLTQSHYRQSRNIYTNAGYYFVTDREDLPAAYIEAQGTDKVSEPATTFFDRLHYENDISSPGEAGFILVGESFKNQNDRKFTFAAPGRVEGSKAWMETGIVAKTFTSTKANFYINGEKLPEVSTDKLSAISNSAYLHGDYFISNRTFPGGGTNIEVKISINNVTSTQNVWLDYISINYERNLQLTEDGYLNFWSDKAELKLDTNGASDVTIWDVTDPTKVTELNAGTTNGAIQWSNDYSGMRTYAAWNPNAKLPSPTFVADVSNQNIHGMDNAEMVIITLPEYKAQAERIAKLHRNAQEPLVVHVLNAEDIYNEFASGAGDVAALRKCLKMFYDRGKSDTIQLRYALLIGRATYDNRHLTSQFQGATAYNTLPYYMGGIPKGQLSDNTAYGTDDVIAMLEDNSGGNLGLDDLSIALGRMPVTSVSEAKSTVDKLYQYVEESARGTWKNSFLFLADDGDNGIHAQQTENAIECLKATEGAHNFITKVYVDAYDIVGGICEGGRSDMYRLLDEGVVWWSYSGHANNHSWTGEGMLTYTDINNMYLKKLPVVMAATCDFLRWDSNTISGGEIMFHERNGGAIAIISATRPVYISDNGLFTKAIGRAISKRDENGRLPRLGDIYRTAKNNILTDNGEHRSNPNRLRYVLMGDPAMMMPTPSNIVRLETIDGVEVTPENQATLKALQQAELKGAIYRPDGTKIDDFNGPLQVNIYDAERSITTKGVRDENIQLTYEQHGEKLFAGSANVVNGEFTLKVAMPGEVADNFRPATINMYASSTDGKTEAVGVNNDFYVYGYDESVEADTQAPVIESMVLNHSSFVDGDVVNESPMMIATVSDNIGINLSAAGVGHQMVLTLDGRRTYTDVSMFYIPDSDGKAGGEIRYPLSDLSQGEHTLHLKVWDTAANSATKQITFNVNQNETPTIFDVYTDVNPASTEVRFYVKHNRPDAEMTVTITVFDMLGHTMWETTSKGPSDMFVSAPVTWDLCDTSGRRLPRGIYLYRATISTNNGDTFDSAARRLAITAQ